MNDTWRVGDSPRAARQLHGELGTVPEFGLDRARNVPVWAMGLNFDSKTRGRTDADYERLA